MKNSQNKFIFKKLTDDDKEKYVNDYIQFELYIDRLKDMNKVQKIHFCWFFNNIVPTCC